MIIIQGNMTMKYQEKLMKYHEILNSGEHPPISVNMVLVKQLLLFIVNYVYLLLYYRGGR